MVSWQTTTANLFGRLTVKQLLQRDVSVEKLRSQIGAVERLFAERPPGFEFAHDHPLPDCDAEWVRPACTATCSAWCASTASGTGAPGNSPPSSAAQRPRSCAAAAAPSSRSRCKATCSTPASTCAARKPCSMRVPRPCWTRRTGRRSPRTTPRPTRCPTCSGSRPSEALWHGLEELSEVYGGLLHDALDLTRANLDSLCAVRTPVDLVRVARPIQSRTWQFVGRCVTRPSLWAIDTARSLVEARRWPSL